MRRLVLASVLVACALAAPAIAAYVCHPDPVGTQVVRLHGHVAGYAVHGKTALLALERGSSCTSYRWNTASGRVARAAVPCATIVDTQRPSPPKTVRIVRAPAGVDRPDRIVAVGRSWPLPVRVRRGTLQVAGDFAAYAALGGHGLWVTRLSTGQTSFVAPVQSDERPLLTRRGVLYVDNVYKRAAQDRPVVKFVPTRALARETQQVGRTLHTDGAIRAFSLSGTRIAIAVAGQACDRVYFWDVPWRSYEQVSQNAGVTCSALGASGRISQIALAGARAQWVTSQNGTRIIVAADDIGCQEWVIGRMKAKPILAADATTLAYTAPHSLAHLRGNYRAQTVGTTILSPVAVAVSGPQTAVLAGREILIQASNGHRLASLAADAAQGLAMRGRTIVATTRRGTLDVYVSGRRVHSWPLPAGARRAVDLQYGIAVVTAGRNVYGVAVATGRTALLASTPAIPRAQIGSVGVAVAYSRGNRGTVEILPLSQVEAAVR